MRKYRPDLPSGRLSAGRPNALTDIYRREKLRLKAHLARSGQLRWKLRATYPGRPAELPLERLRSIYQRILMSQFVDFTYGGWHHAL